MTKQSIQYRRESRLPRSLRSLAMTKNINMANISNQKGFSLIIAIVILIIFGIIAAMLTSLVTTDSDIAMYETRSKEALYIANAGQQYLMKQNYPPARVSTQINVVGSNGFIIDPPGALSADINSTATTIPAVCRDKGATVDCNTLFPSSGRILIESELIDYTGVGASSFTGATRGRGNSLATSHATNKGIYHATALTASRTSSDTTILVSSTSGFMIPGTIKIDQEFLYCTGTTGGFSSCTRGTQGDTPGFQAVVHNAGATAIQITATVTGTVPTGIIGDAKRVLRAQAGKYLDGWIIGNTAGGVTPPALIRWNGINWDNIPSQLGVRQNFNSISGLDTNSDGAVDDGWAVGNFEADPGEPCAQNTPNIFRFSNGSWACTNNPLNSFDRITLNSVYALSPSDVWTVGNFQNLGGQSCLANTPSIFHWNGAAWSCLNTNNSNDRMTLNSVFALSNTDVWTVGNFQNRAGQTCAANTPSIFHWNGAAWSCASTNNNNDRRNLNSVFAVSSADVWVVGDTTNRNGATCANGSATIFHRSGGVWSCANTGAPSVNYFSIHMLDTNGDGVADDGWAVGAAGTLIRWNGTTWSQYTSPTANQLNEVFMARPQNFLRLADWQEVY